MINRPWWMDKYNRGYSLYGINAMIRFDSTLPNAYLYWLMYQKLRESVSE